MAKSISVITAQFQTDPTGRSGGRTGQVDLHATLDWLKDAPVATATMSPKAARALAMRLLVAAARAEGDNVTIV